MREADADARAKANKCKESNVRAADLRMKVDGSVWRNGKECVTSTSVGCQQSCCIFPATGTAVWGGLRLRYVDTMGIDDHAKSCSELVPESV